MPTTNALTRVLTRRTPQMFGRYNLLGRIAMGGMAEVYVARCGELMGMQTLIALKRILPVHVADEKFVQMFQREASIALRLQHRSIARVFEVGKVDNDWYLSLELVQGENLARVSDALEAHGLHWDPDLMAFIGAEVAQALHYAHSLLDARGRPLKIVHRDISPENIMLGFDGSVKVIDFGIAMCESYASLTTQGAVRGKVQYVSPEQAQTHKLDGRSDLFSLGVVLHECLAGSQPFERTSPMDTLEAVVNKWVPPLTHVSPALNEAIIKALEKDPRRRYNDGQEFSAALLKSISGQDAAGPSKVSQLVTSLFPQRLARWRQIQEMALEGFGFAEKAAGAPDQTPPPTTQGEPADSEKSTRLEKYYVVSSGGGESPSPAGKPSSARRFARAAGATLAMTVAAALLFLLGRAPGPAVSQAEANRPPLPTSTAQPPTESNHPRIVPITVERAPDPQAPPPHIEPPPPQAAPAAPQSQAKPAKHTVSKRKKAKARRLRAARRAAARR